MALSESLVDWFTAQQLATKGDIANLKNELEAKMAEIKAELIKWVIGVGFAQVAMILAVIKIH